MDRTIATELGLRPEHVAALLKLLEEENTVPFIARYRSDKIGGLSPQQIREVIALKTSLSAVKSKADKAIATLEAKGVLTEGIRKALLNATDLEEITEIVAPFKEGSARTKAGAARQRGLEPSALAIIQGNAVDFHSLIKTHEDLESFKNVEQGLVDLIAELIANDSKISELFKETFAKSTFVSCTLKKSKTSGKGKHPQAYKFERFNDFRRTVISLKNHDVLALDRGRDLGVLTVSLQLPASTEKHLQQQVSGTWRERTAPQHSKLIGLSVDKALTLLIGRQKRNVWKKLVGRAHKGALKVFKDNLEPLLLAQPVPNCTILGIDPGFSHGCKVAVIDSQGSVLDTTTIYPHAPQSRRDESLTTLGELLVKHRCNVIAIGNGTACRETEVLVSALSSSFPELVYTVVNEAGASVYSVSPDAEEELPDLNPLMRGAVSIARRLQDPLAELVKIDPQSLGVGMYQKDLDESQVKEAATEVLQDCVHKARIDLNRANARLLEQVAGLTKARAKAIVQYRIDYGLLKAREELKKIPGIGAKTFQQCAGFLRVSFYKTISESINALDNTSIHPESYNLAASILRLLKMDTAVIGSKPLCHKVANALADEAVAANLARNAKADPTLVVSVLKSLQESSDYDPREAYAKPLFSHKARSFSDVTVGMTLPGRVGSVTDFGVFVDCGVEVDVLVRGQTWEDLRVGSIVDVTINTIDKEHQRLSGTFSITKPLSSVAPKSSTTAASAETLKVAPGSAVRTTLSKSPANFTSALAAPNIQTAPSAKSKLPSKPSNAPRFPTHDKTSIPTAVSRSRDSKGGAKVRPQKRKVTHETVVIDDEDFDNDHNEGARKAREEGFDPKRPKMT